MCRSGAYLGVTGSLRQLLSDRQSSQKNPHGPQPASVTLKAARTTTNATRRTIGELPTNAHLYTNSDEIANSATGYSANTCVTCPILRPARTAVLP